MDTDKIPISPFVDLSKVFDILDSSIPLDEQKSSLCL